MKKVLIVGVIVIAGILILLSYEKTNLSDESMVKPDTEMMERQEDGDKMMKQEDTIEVNQDNLIPDNAMVRKDAPEAAGIYANYSASAVESALASGKKVALFFHAPWCPTCKSADTALLQEKLSLNTIVFKTDYDSNTELKKKYGVTYQHTFVSLNSDGTLMKKASGLSTAEEIAKLF